MPLTWSSSRETQWNDVLLMKRVPSDAPAVVEALEDAVSVHFFSSVWLGPAHSDTESIGARFKANVCPVTACSAEPRSRALFGDGGNNSWADVPWGSLNIDAR